MSTPSERPSRVEFDEPGLVYEPTFLCYHGFAFLRAEHPCRWVLEAMKRGRGRPCGPPTDVVRTTLDDGKSEGARVPVADSEALAKRASDLGLKKGPLIGALIRVFLLDHEAAAVILESSAWPRK